MAIRRGPLPGDGFTIVPHDWTRSPNLTMAEKGALTYIASHAAGYELTIGQMIAETAEGERAIRTLLTSLEAKGYLRLVRQRGPDGRLGGYDYELVPHPASDQGGAVQTGSDQAKDGVSAGGDQSAQRRVDTSSLEDQEKTSSEEGAATAPPADEEKPETAQDVVAAWVDYCTGREIKLPRQVIGRYAREIKTLIEQGYPVALLKHALALMLKRGKASHPALLPQFVVEVQGSRPPEPSGNLRQQYRTGAEKDDERRTEREEVARIADELAAAEGATGRDPLQNARITEQARQIHRDRSTSCQATGYSGHSEDRVVDAEWWPTSERPREVTAT